MAGITFGVEMAGGGSIEQIAQVADNDVARIISWALAKYNKQDPADAIKAWISDVVGTALVAVRDHEAEAAAQAARAAVQLIPVTILEG